MTMSKLEKMRQRQGLAPRQEPPKAEVVQAEREVSQAKVEKPKASLSAPPESVTHSCKHITPLQHLRSSPCPSCRKQNARARREREAAKKEAKQEVPGRLPSGSRFQMSYDASAVLWTGTLTVPGCPEPFAGSASGLHKLCHALDAMFRAWQSGIPDSPRGRGLKATP